MRRTISAPFRNFIKEIRSLERLDDDNQSRPLSNRPRAGTISKNQLFLLNEGVFFSAYKLYENYIEEIFILYTMKKENIRKKKMISYLNTGSYDRNRRIIKQNNRFIDWTDPDAVISRSDLLFKGGGIIKDVVSRNKSSLSNMRRIRNHIAHNSLESSRQYRQVLQTSLLTIPLKLPSVGEFLNTNTTNGDYFLRIYLDDLKRIAHELVH